MAIEGVGSGIPLEPLGRSSTSGGIADLSPVGGNVSIQTLGGSVPVTFGDIAQLSSEGLQATAGLPDANLDDINETLHLKETSHEHKTRGQLDTLSEVLDESNGHVDNAKVLHSLLQGNGALPLASNDESVEFAETSLTEAGIDSNGDITEPAVDSRLARTGVDNLQTQVEFLRDYEQAAYGGIENVAGGAALALVKDDIKAAFDSAVSELEEVSKDPTVDTKTKNKTVKKLLSNGKPKGYKVLARIKQKIAVRKFEQAGLKGKPLPKFNKKAGLTLAVAAYAKGRIKAEAKTSTNPSIQSAKKSSVKELFNGIKSEFTQVLSKNSERWQPFQRNIDLGDGVVAKVGYTPARHLSEALSNSYGDVQGASSLDRVQTQHTSNAVKTEVEIEGTPFKFEGLRHGVHDAFGAPAHLPDGQELTADIQTLRARESVQILATSVPDRLQQTPEIAARLGQGVYELPIVSINLETPELIDKGRGRVNNQLAAFQYLQGEPIEVKIPGRPDITHVVPNFVALNSPVAKNAGYVTNALNGLDNAHRTNTKGLETLIGKPGEGGYSEGFRPRPDSLVGQKLADLSVDPVGNRDKINLINNLVAQVVESYSAKKGSPNSYRNIGSQPYEFSVRLAALANEADLGVCFNCKSGKDRTGQLDTRIKDFYSDLGRQYLHNKAQNSANPASVTPRPLTFQRDGAQTQQLQRLHEQGGSRDNQIANTGLPGTKGGYGEVYREFGYEKGDFDPLVGLSKFSVS